MLVEIVVECVPLVCIQTDVEYDPFSTSICTFALTMFGQGRSQSELQVTNFFSRGEECGEVLGDKFAYVSRERMTDILPPKSTTFFTPNISNFHHLELRDRSCVTMWKSSIDKAVFSRTPFICNT